MNLTLDLFALLGAICSLALTFAVFYDVHRYKVHEAEDHGVQKQHLSELEKQLEALHLKTEGNWANGFESEKSLIEQRKDIEQLKDKIDMLMVSVEKLSSKFDRFASSEIP